MNTQQMENFKKSVRILLNVVTNDQTKLMPLSFSEQKLLSKAIDEVCAWLQEKKEEKPVTKEKKSK